VPPTRSKSTKKTEDKDKISQRTGRKLHPPRKKNRKRDHQRNCIREGKVNIRVAAREIPTLEKESTHGTVRKSKIRASPGGKNGKEVRDPTEKKKNKKKQT